MLRISFHSSLLLNNHYQSSLFYRVLQYLVISICLLMKMEHCGETEKQNELVESDSIG